MAILHPPLLAISAVVGAPSSLLLEEVGEAIVVAVGTEGKVMVKVMTLHEEAGVEAKDAQDVVVDAIIMEGDRMKIGTLKVGDVMMAIIET